MKRVILSFCLFLSFLALNAQDQPDYASIRLDVKEDYTEEVNNYVVKAASYILTTPIDKKSKPRLLAYQFLMRWMTGTPHFTFEIGEPATKISKGNDDLLFVYLAAMAKFCIENPEEKADKAQIKLVSVKQVLSYCQTQQVPMNKELKKLHKANEAGELQNHLK